MPMPEDMQPRQVTPLSAEVVIRALKEARLRRCEGLGSWGCNLGCIAWKRPI